MVKIKIKKGIIKEEGPEKTEANEAEQDQNTKEKSNNINGKHGKLKRKAKLKEETLVSPESPNNEIPKTAKGTETETYVSVKIRKCFRL